MSDSHTEKLALARKKLKKFQKQKHQEHVTLSESRESISNKSISSSGHPNGGQLQLHSSMDSLAESSVSLPNYFRRDRNSSTARPETTSGIEEDTATNNYSSAFVTREYYSPRAVDENRDLASENHGRTHYHDESHNQIVVDTDVSTSCSSTPNFTATSSASGFFHDEQRSPFQRIQPQLFESDSSDSFEVIGNEALRQAATEGLLESDSSARSSLPPAGDNDYRISLQDSACQQGVYVNFTDNSPSIGVPHTARDAAGIRDPSMQFLNNCDRQNDLRSGGLQQPYSNGEFLGDSVSERGGLRGVVGEEPVSLSPKSDSQDTLTEITVGATVVDNLNSVVGANLYDASLVVSSSSAVASYATESSLVTSAVTNIPTSSVPHFPRPSIPTHGNSDFPTLTVETSVAAPLSFPEIEDAQSADAKSSMAASRLRSQGELMEERDGLVVQLQEREQEYRNLYEQFTAVQSHYAQLHSAYDSMAKYSQQLVQQMQQQSSAANGEQQHNDAFVMELQRQLQQHLQTISVLVAEKAGLQNQLRKAVETSQEREATLYSSSQQIKTQKERIEILEGELNRFFADEASTKGSQETLESKNRRLDQLERSESILIEERNELRIRLAASTADCGRLREEVEKCQHELQMKDIYLQQLTAKTDGSGSEPMQSAQPIPSAVQEAQRKQLEESVEHWKNQTQIAQQRYETYGRQLNEKLADLQQKLDASQSDKYSLEIMVAGFEREISRLRSSKNEDGPSAAESKERFEEVQQTNEVLQQRVAELSNCYAETVNDLEDAKSRLEATLISKKAVEDQCESFRKEIERMQESNGLRESFTTDAESLLSSIQNEKATASRAVEQNQELKGQIAELQDRFVKNTEEFMECKSALQTAEHAIEVMSEKLEKKQDEVERLEEKHQIDTQNLREEVTLLMRQQFEREQIEDRMRHYEASYQSVFGQLQEAKRSLASLELENEKLRELCSKREDVSPRVVHTPVPSEPDSSSLNGNQCLENGDGGFYKDKVKSLEDDLQEEKLKNSEIVNELKQSLAAVTKQTEMLQMELEQTKEHKSLLDESRTAVHNGDVNYDEKETDVELSLSESVTKAEAVSGVEINGVADDKNPHSSSVMRCKNCAVDMTNERAVDASFRFNMEQLQERFAQTMLKNADLSDQNQNLEHLIEQLQTETETVGEYITIYQHHRKLVRDRLRAKEDYIAKLSHEKEEVASKLSELQTLVMHLLQEKGSMRPYRVDHSINRSRASSTSSGGGRSTKPLVRPKKLSETLVDETTGEEELLQMPGAEGEDSGYRFMDSTRLADVNGGEPLEDHLAEITEVDDDRQDTLDHGCDFHREDDQHHSRRANTGGGGDFHTTQKILKLLAEMKTPGVHLPPVDRNLHCRYCMGKLEVV